ncbi:hypothetical protein ACFFK0_13825 [Paenibacillus chartarius]|uniref:ABC transporter permease n=1 Tax=Paenibacillus chartarius TaxID=747481 RepID=A0ABV6DLJ9_9BACL
MPFFHKTYLLLIYSFRIGMNRTIFLLSRFLNPAADESKWRLILKKYIRLHLILLYVSWVLVTVLLQVLFSYVPIPSEKLNVLLMASLLLGMVFIFSYPQQTSMTFYITHSTLPYSMKKKLIVIQAFLGSSVTLTIITLLLLPFLIAQWAIYGLEGGRTIVNLLVILLFYGIVVDFIKYLANLYRHFQPAYTNSIIRMAVFLVVYGCTPEIARVIQSFIDGYILNLYDRESANLFLREVIRKIPIQLSDLHIHWKVGLACTTAAACLIAGMLGSSYLFFREVQRRPIDIRWWKTSDFRIAVFTHFFRKYGLFNHQIALMLVISYLLSYYFAESMFEFYFYTSVLLPVLVLATSFFVLEGGTESIMLLKRYRMTALQVSTSYSCYLFAQFFIYQFLLLLLSDGHITSSFIADMVVQGLLGSILLYSIVFVYIATIYHMEGIIEANILQTYSKSLIYMYATVQSAVIYMITRLHWFPDAAVQLLAPILVLIVFEFGIRRLLVKLGRGKE